MANPFGKTRKVEDAYAVYTDSRLPGWEWRVLKTYQAPENAKSNAYARAFCAVRSPYTYGGWEYGDTYLHDIGRQFVSGTDVLAMAGRPTYTAA